MDGFFGSVLAFLGLILLFGTPLALRSKYFNRKVLHRKAHEGSLEALKPLKISTQLPLQDVIRTIQDGMPEPSTMLAAGIKVKNVGPTRIDLGVTGAGSNTDFSVIASHEQSRTAVRIVTARWMTKRGVFTTYKALVKAQNKVIGLLAKHDKDLQVVREKV